MQVDSHRKALMGICIIQSSGSGVAAPRISDPIEKASLSGLAIQARLFSVGWPLSLGLFHVPTMGTRVKSENPASSLDKPRDRGSAETSCVLVRFSIINAQRQGLPTAAAVSKQQ